MVKRPLYVGRPLVDEPDRDEFEILEEYGKGYNFLELARELWRLAGREDRAEAIEDAILSAFRYRAPRIDREHIVALREALEGLDDALVGPVIDEEQHLLSMDKVRELRGRPEIQALRALMDLDESRGELARHAIQEALVYVDHLRRIAERALEADAQILLD